MGDESACISVHDDVTNTMGPVQVRLSNKEKE